MKRGMPSVVIIAITLVSMTVVGMHFVRQLGAPLHVTLTASARSDRLPFEVHWSAQLIGGTPPFSIESPSGIMSLTREGNISGVQLFTTNRHPLTISITARDQFGRTASARSTVKCEILTGSSVLFNGTKLAPGSTRYRWKQLHNPDRYDGLEYVTGNEAEISLPSSPNPFVRFEWPGLYRFSLTTGSGANETSHALEVLVNLSRSPFGLRGAGLPMYDLDKPGRLLQENLNRIVAWGGNLAAIHFNLYVPHPNASVILPSWELPLGLALRPPTPGDEQLEAWIRLAHQRGLSVLVVPHVVYVGMIRGIYPNRTTWVEPWQMKPENQTAWFQSYKEWVLHYAAIAERTGVEIFSLGADLGSSQYVPNVWREMISDVRKIYHGKITVTEAPGWGYPWRLDPPDFMQDIDLMNFDFNYRGSEDLFHPRTGDMAKRFSEFLQGNHRWMAVPYMKRYGKPWLVNALGCPNGDGVNRYLHLHGENLSQYSLHIDNQEQVDYVEAGFRALSQLAKSEVGDLLMGVIIWSLNDWPVPPDFIDWSVAGRPVEEAIRLWFSPSPPLRPPTATALPSTGTFAFTSTEVCRIEVIVVRHIAFDSGKERKER